MTTPVTAPAGASARVLSYLVDLGVVIAAAGFVWVLLRSGLITAIVAVEAAIVLSIARAATGRTPGALLTRTVGYAEGTDRAPGLGRQTVRSAVLGGLHLTVIGPLATYLTSRDGRDWVDRLAGTAVADLRPRITPRALATDPYGRPTAALTEPVAGWQQPAAIATTPTAAEPRRAFGAAAQPWIVLDSGGRIEVDAVLVLGRDPEANTLDERAVAIPDPGRSLSRTHVRIGADEGGVWVEDAWSANGTSVRTQDGRTATLSRGQRMRVPDGATVAMGDRSLTVRTGDAG